MNNPALEGSFMFLSAMSFERKTQLQSFMDLSSPEKIAPSVILSFQISARILPWGTRIEKNVTDRMSASEGRRFTLLFFMKQAITAKRKIPLTA